MACQDCPHSLPLPCHLTAALLCLGLAAVTQPLPLAGSMLLNGKAPDNHRTPASPCAPATSAEQMHSWEPWGCREQGSSPFPHTFTFLHHPLLFGHPSTSSPFTVCLRKFPAPGNTNPFHMLSSKTSQQDHNLLVLPIG